MTRRQWIASVVASLVVLAAPPPLFAQRGVLRIYLARHGETDWNRQGRAQGSLDIPLDDTGRMQAAELRDTLRGVHLDAVYSSTLSRSRETAQIAAPGLPLKSLDALKERNQGRFQGGQGDDPDLVRRRNDPDDTLDGGESLVQLAARVRQALAQIRREHPAGTVLIVGHSITNKMILATLLGIDISTAARTIQQANDELYMIELQQGAAPRLWKLIRDRNLGDL